MAKKKRGQGEGSIYQRSSGSWRVQIIIDNKRAGKTFTNKSDGLSWLRKMQSQDEQGFDYFGSMIPLGEYMNQWLDAARTALREKTAYQYQRLIEKHINPYIGEIPLKDLRLSKIEQFYRTLILSGLGPRTVKIVHSVLHRAFEKAVMYSLLISNPAHGATLPKYQHAEMQIWDEVQVMQFLSSAHESRYEALYHLAVKTGMRQGELLGLKWSDLQWHNGTLLVQRQVQKIPRKGWSFLTPKTKSGRRAIKVGDATLQILFLHRERQGIEKAFTGEHWKEHGLIFTSKVGTPGDPSNLRLDFNRLIGEAGLPKIRFHDLRHTSASLMLNHGVPVIVVSKRLGHSQPSTTLDVYGHLYHELQNDAARIMDELVTPVPVELSEMVGKDLS